MRMAKKKTVGQHVDHAIAKTGDALKKTGHHVKKHSQKIVGLAKDMKSDLQKETKQTKKAQKETNKLFIILGVIAVLLIILVLFLLFSNGCNEKATTEQAQSIAKMLAADEVPIRGIKVDGCGYEFTYAAEDAVGRFDDAMIYDWGMMYGTAAAHDCDMVSIVTTILGEPMHKQSVQCEAVRAFVRGVFTEEEFWLLVEHENLG
jgi:hypothetical protein